ncbi:MucBP domain-containing protein [Vagococcus bubulae]|uniref:Gram-positive cocci surface proteins LPxTG domain-containing protein n=1 Tax=Vagococcus bubulae TaxID=1977868 RepID=A0A429ZR42_9ENTE|nr:MucBP domain-containing protein [Vagococcus bubulae]RST96173.1 hypothetical protein CBF36_00120 [Vagococcus bubulae]
MRRINKATVLLIFLCSAASGGSLIVHSKTSQQLNHNSPFIKDTLPLNTTLINNNSPSFRSGESLSTEIAPSTAWFSKTVFPGYEDEIDELNEESIVWDSTPFILKRNTKKAVFQPLCRIDYSTFANRTDLSKIKYTFTLNGPGTIDWNDVTLFREADHYQYPTTAITLTQESQNVYTYEIDISQIAQTVNSEDLFVFGLKVNNLDYDIETNLSFKTEVYYKSDPTIITVQPNINGISFAKENLQLNLPPEKKLCVGDTPPNYKDGASSSLDFQSQWWPSDFTGKTSDITIDSTQVDYNTPGTYQVNYSVTSETGETTVTKDLDVTIVDNSITINYQDEEGNILQTNTLPYQAKGTPFSEKSPAIPGYSLKNQSDKTIEGTFNCDAQTFNVTYKKDSVTPPPAIQYGKVTTLFIDENGNSIAAPVVDNGVVGTDYQTSPIDIEGYTLTSVPNNKTGKFSNENITVTYVYKKDVVTPPSVEYGQVTTVFVDENGHSIAAPVVDTGIVGTDYQTYPIEIDGYTLISVPNNEYGQFIDGTITVTYIYKANDVTPPINEYGQVTTFFVDEDGNSIAAPVVDTGIIGTNYQTSPIDIEGYTLISVPNNEIGQFINGNITVTYVYQKDETIPPSIEYGQVTTLFVDENGNSISKPIVETGIVGETYQTSPIDIEGYTLISVPNNEIGQFINGDITVTYVYQKDETIPPSIEYGQITTLFVDENGQSIAESIVETGIVGEDYQTHPIEINGYRLVSVPDNERGKFGNENINVTYVYERISDDSIIDDTKDDNDVEKNDENNVVNNQNIGNGKTDDTNTTTKDAILPSTNNTSKKLLPKTSEAKENKLVILGLMMSSITSLITVFRRQK